jgi:hypothetical protein
MKESEFIALLNLYLDHEISAADAARLEAEVQSRPDRRKIYQQYCRMQKACKVLAADFETEEAGAPGDKKVVAFDAAASQRRSGNFYTVGAFVAAAACVAIIFVGRSRQEATANSNRAANTVAATTVSTPAPAAAPIVSKTSPRQLGNRAATLVTDPLLLTHNPQAEATLAAAVKEANAQLAWINTVQLSPLQQQVQAEELRFDVSPATLRPDARALGANPAPKEAAVEMVVFQFSK